MDTLFLNIIFAGSAAVIGVVVGWILCASGNSDSADKLAASGDSEAAPELPPEPTPPKANMATVETMMARLHQLTESMAADVGEHHSRVQEINLELVETAANDPNVVVIVEQLMKVNETMQSQLQEAEERLQVQSVEMASHVEEARTDSLTHLFNRRGFDDEIAKLEAAWTDQHRPSCIMMIDVDHFKKFNDTYGHQAGDQVLRSVARVLRKNLASKEIVCRYGGEEFAVLFPGSDLQTAIPAAERARAAIAESMVSFEGKELKVTASGGLAQLTAGETCEETVKRADDALYVCKESGRNCGYSHDGENTRRMGRPAAPEVAVEDSPAEPEKTECFTVAVSEPAEDRRDNIVGVSTRDAFIADVDRRVAEHRRGGATVSILLIEIDDFENIRTTAGLRTSQLVLRATAQFLKATMRDMDHVARFDDHQFALLLPGAGISDTSAIAERLRMAVSNTELPVKGGAQQYTISLGAVEVSGAEDRESLVARAQLSLDAAKDAGGNRSFASTDQHEREPQPIVV